MSGRTDATTGMGRTIDINGMKKEPDPHASNLSEPFKRFFYDGLDGGYPTRQPKYLFIINVIWRRRRDSNPRDGSPSAPLAGVCLRPLGHISACASSREAGGKTRRNSRNDPDCSMGMRHQGLGRSRAAGAAVCDPAGDRNASTRRNLSYRCGGLEARRIARSHVLNLFPDI